MEKEIIACIKDSDIKYLHSGQISKHIFPMEREEAHKKKISHLIIRFFVVSFSPEGEPFFLVQKRSSQKKTFPQYFTDSASGHVLYRKNISMNHIKEDAKRELEEEFGINSKLVKKIHFYNLKTEEHDAINEISYIFIGEVNYNVSLTPDPNEVEVKFSHFYSKSELSEILKEKDIVDYSKSIWKDLVKMDLKQLFYERKINLNNLSRALIVGRFQPLHHGHVYVLKRIFEIHENVKIGIGSSQLSNIYTDPFSDAERKDFIIAALRKRDISPNRYEIFSIPDIFNAQKWVDHVISIVGDFDVVYSNSDWVRQLFKKRGFALGNKIEIFKNKFNGTTIRKLIATKNDDWRKLVPKEVQNIMISNDGLKRIQKLYIEHEKQDGKE